MPGVDIRRCLGGYVVLLAAGLVACGDRTTGVDDKSPDNSPAAAKGPVLSEVAAEIGQGLPMLVDEETELSRVTTSGSVLIYHFRLINTDREQVDATELATRLEPLVTEQVCTSPDTGDGFLRHGVTLRYVYADRRGDELSAFDVTPQDCGFEEQPEP